MNLNKKSLRNVGTIMIMPIIGCILSACNSGNGSTGATSATATATAAQDSSKVNSAPLGDALYIMRMGSGIDSVTKTAASGQTCLANTDNIIVDNPTQIINFSEEQTMSALEKALNVDVTTKFGGDRFNSSLAANFANSAKNNQYTTNLVYLTEYAGKSVFKDGSLGQGLDALTSYTATFSQTSPTDFRAMCGNEFVEQMDAGATLAVNVSLNFNSHLDQEKFIANLGSNISLSDITVALEQTATISNVPVKTSLSTLQLGGQPNKLTEVLNGSGASSSVVCSSQDGGNTCDTLIDNIVTYAQTLGDQLVNADGSLNMDALYYTNPISTPYTDLGITMQVAADPSQEILNAMEKLTSDYDKAVYDYNFSSHYLTVLSDKLDSPTRSNLDDSAKRLYSQVYDVYLLQSYDVVDCYKGYVTSQCLKIQANVEDGLTPYELQSSESTLLAYLEANSYSGNLMNYFGGTAPVATDYALSASECTFAPVSSSSKAHYAINCDGQWLDTYNYAGITLMPGFDYATLIVTDLAYVSTPPNSSVNGQLITYSDVELPVEAAYDNYFYSNEVTVSAPQYTTNTAELGLTRLYQNPV